MNIAQIAQITLRLLGIRRFGGSPEAQTTVVLGAEGMTPAAFRAYSSNRDTEVASTPAAEHRKAVTAVDDIVPGFGVVNRPVELPEAWDFLEDADSTAVSVIEVGSAQHTDLWNAFVGMVRVRTLHSDVPGVPTRIAERLPRTSEINSLRHYFLLSLRQPSPHDYVLRRLIAESRLASVSSLSRCVTAGMFRPSEDPGGVSAAELPSAIDAAVEELRININAHLAA